MLAGTVTGAAAVTAWPPNCTALAGMLAVCPVLLNACTAARLTLPVPSGLIWPAEVPKVRRPPDVLGNGNAGTTAIRAPSQAKLPSHTLFGRSGVARDVAAIWYVVA